MRASLNLLLLTLATAFLIPMATWGQQGGSDEEPPGKIKKTPGEAARQIYESLKKNKTPWRIYDEHSKIFNQFAAQAARATVRSKQQAKQRQQLVDYYQKMASLITEMQRYAKIRDEIRLNQTKIHFGERQKKFLEARRKHDALLKQFAKAGSKLPKFDKDKK